MRSVREFGSPAFHTAIHVRIAQIGVLLLLSASLVLWSGEAGAQAARAVVDGTLLRPGTDTLRAIRAVKGVVDTVGVAIQTLALVREPSGQAWLQVFKLGGAVDSLVMDRHTLQPIRETRSIAGGRVRVQYSATSIHARVENDPGGTHARDTTLTTPMFASSELDDIARTLPLSPSYRGYADLYYLYPAPFSADRAGFTVIGSDVLRLANGQSISCWIVRVTGARAGGGTRMWVDKQTRAAVQNVTGDSVSGTLTFRR
jgi:hypothetical protein